MSEAEQRNRRIIVEIIKLREQVCKAPNTFIVVEIQLRMVSLISCLEEEKDEGKNEKTRFDKAA